jgi:predicted enzyme related to lactoylglutathione lyase
MKDLAVSADGGVVPYVYVDRVTETVTRIAENGGVVDTAPYREGDLWVALFLDPAGNRMGLWQRGPLA